MQQDSLLDKRRLSEGWSFATTSTPLADPRAAKDLVYLPAAVPGTVASALRDLKQWRPGSDVRFDDQEHWFRCQFDSPTRQPGDQVLLHCGGIATISELWLNGTPICSSSSMFAEHTIDVTTLLRDQNELYIVCRSLTEALKTRRSQVPAARWRTRVIVEQQLRWFRTTLLGRAPGFAPEPPPIGPWKPISLIHHRAVATSAVTCRAHLRDSVGHVHASFALRSLTGTMTGATLRVGEHQASFLIRDGQAEATLQIHNPQRWFPHTHGTPYRYPVSIDAVLADGSSRNIHNGHVAFRTMTAASLDQFALSINDVDIFARGVIWTPLDAVSLQAPVDVIRQRLQTLRDGGFNMIRIAGTTVYEDESFHDLLDELGFLLWQDLLFANMDYPLEEPSFHDLVMSEVTAQLTRLSQHVSTVVICGNSEIEQQVTMLGLDPGTIRSTFFHEDLPALTASLCPDAAYVSSAPTGGDLPFRTNRGIANYFGVGAYLRPLEDARLADVKFASECLAFSNVPEPETVEEMSLATRGGISPTHPAWKRAVPRDAGTGWDFEDVRDHYLKLLYRVEPASLRYAELDRYYELSRMTSAEVMASVFHEWRRAASSCRGGIILWSTDLEPGAGWGIIDSHGRPKAAYWLLKRALQPRTVWITNEGLNGIDIHVSNDLYAAFAASLHVALYRQDQRVAEATQHLLLPAHTTTSLGLESLLGRFIDASYTYRFGPPAHDLIVATIYAADSAEPVAKSVHFPLGLPSTRESIGLTGEAHRRDDGCIEVLLHTRHHAYGTRVYSAGYRPNDAYFAMEPNSHRRILLTPESSRSAVRQISVTAVNSTDRTLIPIGVTV